MKIAVIGASGFIGRHLVENLIDKTDHQIIAIARHTEDLKDNPKLVKIDCDVFNKVEISNALEGVDQTYYLIHMMAQRKIDYAVAEKEVANIVGEACKKNGVKKIIFLGGLGKDSDNLSKHLRSRHASGEILRQYIPVVEFRASMVIGNGSISYDIIKNLVHKLPVLTVPRWSSTFTQPIGINDVIKYLIAALNLPTNSEIIEIGGPEKMSYKDLMKAYAKFSKRKVFIVDLPIIPVVVSAWWLNLFTPRNEAKVGRAMVESLANEMIVTNDRAKQLFPEIQPHVIKDTFV